MRPLATNRRMLTWLSLCPANDDTGFSMRLVHAAFTFAFISLGLAAFIASTVFCLQFVSTDFGTVLLAFWQIMAYTMVLYMFAVMLISRQKIKSTFETLSDIYRASKFLFL